MTMLDTLRKDYDKLNPFERAVMCIGAMSRKDEAAVDALQPPTLWDAFHDMKTCAAFALLAFMATVESLRADGAAWAGRLGFMIEDRKEEKADEAKLDEFSNLLQEVERRRFAWMLALEALDNEDGTACIPLVDVFADGYAAKMLEDAKGKDVCFDRELERLRDVWGVIAHSIPGAPKLEEAPVARM